MCSGENNGLMDKIYCTLHKLKKVFIICDKR